MARGISTATFVRRASVFAIAGAAATALSACGAGQVSQTDTKQSAIAGVNVDAGDLALRDLQVEFESAEGYEAGSDAPLRVWIDNEGDQEVSLVGVTTEAAESVTLVSADAAEAEPTETEPSEDAASETPEGEDASEEPAGEGAEDGATEEAADEAADEAATEDASEEATEDAEAPVTDEDLLDEEGPAGEASFEIPIAPAEYVSLDKNTEDGDYLQLEGLEEPLLNGETIEVVFEFSNGEEVAVNLPVGQSLEEGEREYVENPGAGGH